MEKESYIIKIGPLMRKALDEQIAKIKEYTYDTANISYYTAGEIIAKKYLGLV
mgnify:CR=1 FL=1